MKKQKFKSEKFDGVEMNRLDAAKVREQTATLTKEQELAFCLEYSRHLRQRQETLKVHTRQSTNLAGNYNNF